MSSFKANRRNVLKGLGVTLGLPWLEALAPRKASAADVKKRWVVMFFPNGTAAFWDPTGTGSGSAWKLSPILEPLAPIKAKTTVMSNVENYSPFGSTSVEPSHSQLAGAFLTCTKCAPSLSQIGNGISADQMLVQKLAPPTPFASLQLGLTTKYADPDGRHPSNSRSISWASPTQPLYKTMNPQTVFDSLMGGLGGGSADPAAEKRRALNKSALDYVMESAAGLQGQLGQSDKHRLDDYLSSVRDLEKRVLKVSPTVSAASCSLGVRPQSMGLNIIPNGYSRNTHAELMLDLVVKAFECDLTRVVSFMMDDERSEYGYTFLKSRNFTASGSVETTANVQGSYHDLQHSGDTNANFATITRWNVEKVSQLATRMDAIKEGGSTLLDSSVIYFGSSMHGGNHSGVRIPSLYIGSGGGVLKTDQHIAFPQEQRLSDIYLTMMQKVFGASITSFANSKGVVPAILA